MPELPEVETIKRSLNRNVKGKRIKRVEVFVPRLIKNPKPLSSFINSLRGRRIERVKRRGKLLILELDKGFLAIHLRIAGGLQYGKREERARLCFLLDDGRWLNYMDARTLGEIRLVDNTESLDFLKRLGPEPFSYSYHTWYRQLQRSRSKIKAFLLDQQKIAGLGNIYACEALFAAKINPFRPASSLTLSESKNLLTRIKQLLRKAIKYKGTTISDYRDAEGKKGKMQFSLKVYQRKNMPCFVCGDIIQRRIIAGRGTYFCPTCQK